MLQRSFAITTPTQGIHAPFRIAALATLLGLAGCSSSTEKEKSELAQQGQEIFASAGSPERSGIEDSVAWSIVIVAYRGPERNSFANADLYKVHTQGGLPRAYVEDRGDASVIAYGRYESPDDPSAQRDLTMIREMVIGGGRPFAGAALTPPSAAKAGSMPEYDLRNVKDRLGDWVIYTLQIGAYGKLDGRATADEMAEFRAAAEEAVLQLRREGEQAFYYHGPTMSSVVIGTWGTRDFEPNPIDGRPALYQAPAILAAKEKFPHNLFNGQAVRSQGRLQPSKLVGVP